MQCCPTPDHWTQPHYEMEVGAPPPSPSLQPFAYGHLEAGQKPYNVLSAICRLSSTLGSGRRQSCCSGYPPGFLGSAGRAQGNHFLLQSPLPSAECTVSPVLPFHRVPPEHPTRLGRWKPMRLQSPAHTAQHKSSFRAGSRIPSGVRGGRCRGDTQSKRREGGPRQPGHALTFVQKHAEVGI